MSVARVGKKNMSKGRLCWRVKMRSGNNVTSWWWDGDTPAALEPWSQVSSVALIRRTSSFAHPPLSDWPRVTLTSRGVLSAWRPPAAWPSALPQTAVHHSLLLTLLPRHSVYSLLSAWALCFSMWPSFHLPLSKKVQRHTRTHTRAHLAVAGFHHIVGSWDSCVNGRGQGGGEDEDGLGLRAPRSGRGREREEGPPTGNVRSTPHGLLR